MTAETYVCTVCGDRCVIRKCDPSPQHCAPLCRQREQEPHDR